MSDRQSYTEASTTEEPYALCDHRTYVAYRSKLLIIFAFVTTVVT
jgi:hypothetical protein